MNAARSLPALALTATALATGILVGTSSAPAAAVTGSSTLSAARSHELGELQRARAHYAAGSLELGRAPRAAAVRLVVERQRAAARIASLTTQVTHAAGTTLTALEARTWSEESRARNWHRHVHAVLVPTLAAVTPTSTRTAAPFTADTGTDPTLGYDAAAAPSLHAPHTLGALRVWDTGTTWCDVQPTAATVGAALDARIARAFAPTLDAAVEHGVQRVIIVVGHPAPWVYGTPTAQAATTSASIWYCPAPQGGFYASANTLPSRAAFESADAASPRARYTAYSRALMRFISTRYAGAFRTDFQTANELNVGLRLDRTAAGTATDPVEAGIVLAEHDAVLHRLATREFAGAGFGVMASSLASGTHASGGVYRGGSSSAGALMTLGYLATLNANPSLVDSLAENSYSGGVYLSAAHPLSTSQREALRADWRDRAGGLRDAVSGTLNTTRTPAGATAGFPRLSGKPLVQTETNHNLVATPDACYPKGGTGCNLTNVYLTDADRRYLADALVDDGHALGISAQLIYRWSPWPTQVAVNLTPGSAALAAVEAAAA